MDGSRRITIQTIADEAQVSKSTVSCYLNGRTEKMSAETRERIARVIQKYDYRPSAAARLLTAGRSCLLGVVVCDITNGFANRLVKGIAQVCRESGYQILVGTSEYDPDAELLHLERMAGMKVDGVILQPTGQPDASLALLRRAGVPVVCIDSKPEGAPLWVATSNYRSTFDAVSACLRMGYTRCLLLSAEPGLLTSRQERCQACLDAAAQVGAPCHVELIGADTPDSEILRLASQGGGGRTLVFVPNCWLLPKVFRALAPLHGEIPARLGLLGFDNEEWAEFSVPSVSTIVQPAFQEGASTAALLIDNLLGKPGIPQNATLACEIRLRGSTSGG